MASPEPPAITLRLQVTKGPDKGKSRVFAADRVTIGRDPASDFVLQDEQVALSHAELRTSGHERGLILTSISSSHQSTVVSNDRILKLRRGRPESIELAGVAQILLGLSVIEVRQVFRSDGPPDALLDASPASPRDEGPARHLDDSAREHIVRRVRDAPDHLARHISAGDRLDVLFRLTRQLNALTRLDDILERVAEATFELFPLASFFAIVVPEASSAGMLPVYKRQRSGTGSAEPILSQSIIDQVVDRKESVLYVRDRISGGAASKSIVRANITSCLAAPLTAQNNLMGVMQVDSRGHNGLFTYADLDIFVVLASSVAFAMERAKLSRNIYEMFEAFVEASVAAIEARDPTTAGHSERVAYYSLLTAEGVNREASGALGLVRFSAQELTELRYAALLHDFGKIGVAERVLQKPSRLMPELAQVILQRIEAHRHRRHHQIQTELLESLVSKGRAPTAEDVAGLDASVKVMHARMSAYRDAILRLQRPESSPLEADLLLVAEMEAVSFTASFGANEELLYADEARDLRILRGTLNANERQHIESHARLTQEYLQRIPWSDDLKNIPCIAGRHHEKLDGSGYPGGLVAENIAPQVRILTVADIFDAVTAADRPYRKALSAEAASGILTAEASAGKLDEGLVSFFNRQIVPSLGPSLRRRPP